MHALLPRRLHCVALSQHATACCQRLVWEVPALPSQTPQRGGTDGLCFCLRPPWEGDSRHVDLQLRRRLARACQSPAWERSDRSPEDPETGAWSETAGKADTSSPGGLASGRAAQVEEAAVPSGFWSRRPPSGTASICSREQLSAETQGAPRSALDARAIHHPRRRRSIITRHEKTFPETSPPPGARGLSPTMYADKLTNACDLERGYWPEEEIREWEAYEEITLALALISHTSTQPSSTSGQALNFSLIQEEKGYQRP
ncbi:unnamed protein product [Lota lota]